MRGHLDAEIFVDRNACGARDPPRDLAHQIFGHARPCAVIGDRNIAEHREEPRAVAGAIAEEIVIDEILLHQHAEDRAQAESVGAGTHLK